jgi:flagellar basal body-associated protein FliL
MKLKTTVKKQKQPSRIVIIIALVAGLALVALGLRLFVFKSNHGQTQAVIEQNEKNAAELRAIKEGPTVVVTEKNDTADAEDKPQQPSQQGAGMVVDPSVPTIDSSGASTNLARKEVYPAVKAVLSLYDEFLAAVQAASEDQRQAVAKQFVDDNSTVISTRIANANFGTLYLLPQSPNLQIPDKFIAKSAIIDPDDPSQVIVQLIPAPDKTISWLVVVKMNGDGTIDKIQRVMLDNFQDPL